MVHFFYRLCNINLVALETERPVSCAVNHLAWCLLANQMSESWSMLRLEWVKQDREQGCYSFMNVWHMITFCRFSLKRDGCALLCVLRWRWSLQTSPVCLSSVRRWTVRWCTSSSAATSSCPHGPRTRTSLWMRRCSISWPVAGSEADRTTRRQRL